MTYEGGIRICCPGKQGKMFYGEGEVNSANTEEGWRWTLSSSQIWQLRGSSLDNHELQSLTAGVGVLIKVSGVNGEGRGVTGDVQLQRQ